MTFHCKTHVQGRADIIFYYYLFYLEGNFMLELFIWVK
jgi:hypothetical protein